MEEPGINIGGTNINNLRFADDTADSGEKLQNLVNVTNISSLEKGME